MLERDQVDHEVRVVNESSWDVYAGPTTTRVSRGMAPLALSSGLAERVLTHLERVLVDGRVHTARCYLAVVEGAITVEGLIDDAADATLAKLVHRADWVLPERGFSSIRWFIAACPRALRPAEFSVRGTCAS